MEEKIKLVDLLHVEIQSMDQLELQRFRAALMGEIPDLVKRCANQAREVEKKQESRKEVA